MIGLWIVLWLQKLLFRLLGWKFYHFENPSDCNFEQKIMVFTLRTSPFTSRWIHLYACNASYALRKTSFKQNWRKTTWKRINNFRFGSTAKVNYVILITDSETFKLKHFSAYFMLKRLESMLSIPQKLKKISKN